ncbi:hypothetical protein JOD82_001819 [Paenibacillus sp. 1182]|uniref:hypothetical protein n=1 Tax=Paenibacillus sp. 1182 TaxID=2806565 RepID=UPI001AE6C1CD|nr:hypothetical protein [Paenibacillus sp. 1182]MBP1308799.1 hypothetical protein [Paenibacillus sp. 1182]
MVKEVLWSECYKYAYGRQAEFTNKEDFEKEVQSQYDDGVCEVKDIKVEPCIYSPETIESDKITPLSLKEICIENYYSAKVERVE